MKVTEVYEFDNCYECPYREFSERRLRSICGHHSYVWGKGKKPDPDGIVRDDTISKEGIPDWCPLKTKEEAKVKADAPTAG